MLPVSLITFNSGAEIFIVIIVYVRAMNYFDGIVRDAQLGGRAWAVSC